MVTSQVTLACFATNYRGSERKSMRYNDSAKAYSSKPLSNATIGPSILLLVCIFEK